MRYADHDTRPETTHGVDRPLVERRRGSPLANRHVLADGTLAGGAAAAAVALWFFVADVVAGRAFFTPARLGEALATLVGQPGLAASPAGAVAWYTLAHVAAWVALGLTSAAVVRRAWRQPTVLAGALLALAVLEVAFVGAVAMLYETTLTGALTWAQVVVGNLVGLASVAVVLWRRNPGLRAVLAVATGGDRRSSHGAAPNVLGAASASTASESTR